MHFHYFLVNNKNLISLNFHRVLFFDILIQIEKHTLSMNKFANIKISNGVG